MKTISRLFNKSKNISVSALFKVGLYKILFKIVLFIEWSKIILNLNNFTKYKLKELDSIKIKNDFNGYFILYKLDCGIIEKADYCMNGNIYLFGKYFRIEDNAWLIDPVSKNDWDKNTLFYKAKVEQEGLADVKYVMELNKMYHLVLLANAFYLTQDEKYLQKIYQLLNSWVAIVKYARSVVNKSMLDISIRCMNLIQVILLCYSNEYFKHKVYPLIMDILFMSEKMIRTYSSARWFKYTTGANHLIGEMAGIIIIQKWIEYQTTQNYKKYYKSEYKYLKRSLDGIITDEGVYLEQSAAYSKIVAEFLIFLDIISSATKFYTMEVNYSDNYLKKILKYLEILSYNNYLPNFGDNDGAKILSSLYDNEFSISHLIRYRKFAYKNFTPNNYLLCKESGQFVWKSHDKYHLYLFTRCGKHSYFPIGSGSHAHNDILSIIVSINDRDLFIDKGTYYYNSGLKIINSNRSIRNHNTISINNLEQAEFAGKWLYGSYPGSKLLSNEIEIEDNRFVFSGNVSYQKRDHARKIEYSNGTMNIYDTIYAKEGDQVSLSFLLAQEIKIIKIYKNKLSLLITKKLKAEMTFNDFIDINIVDTTYYPSYGIERQTKKIIGFSSLKGNQIIKTTIIFKQEKK